MPEQMPVEDTLGNTLQQEFAKEESMNTTKASTSPLGVSVGASDEQYHYYYNRIYPLLKEGQLDFTKIASKTGYKERRIRETLLFRLTAGEVMQLFGRQDGYCYICGYKTHASANNKEPVCMSCLKTLDTAIQEIHLAELSQQIKQPIFIQVDEVNAEGTQNSAQEILSDEAGTLSMFTGEAEHSTTLPDEPISRSHYEQLMQELNQYRGLFGPLPSHPEQEAINTEHSGPCLEHIVATVDLAPEINTSESDSEDLFNDVDPLLKMLAMDDQQVPVELSGSDILPSLMHDPIRHFGFHRLKGGS